MLNDTWKVSNMEFSEKIKTLRKQRGLTLEAIGERVGVGKSTVRKWETGEIKNMGRDKIALLAEALGVTPAYLMGWESEEESHPEDELFPQAASKKWRILSRGLEKMEVEKEEDFERVFKTLSGLYPEFFSEEEEDES